MDESAIKGLNLNGSDDAASRKRRSIKIWAHGYDTSLPEDDVVSALKKHFSSCGDVTHVYIPRDVGSDILNRYAVVYILGEGAEEKALKLSGSDVGGWNVIVRAYPDDQKYRDFAAKRAADCSPQGVRRQMIVTGYDTSLPKDDIEGALRKHFSSCGEVTDVMVPGDKNGGLYRKAVIDIVGDGAVDKAHELSGCDVAGLNIVVVKVIPIGPRPETKRMTWGIPEVLYSKFETLRYTQHVHTNNREGIKFYKKLVFEITYTIHNYYINVESRDCYLVTKSFAQSETSK